MRWNVVGDDLHVTVSDTGRGMDEDTLRQAAEPFFTTRSEGMGLGLFLASTMAERFGGALEFETSPGQGTTATLRMNLKRISIHG